MSIIETRRLDRSSIFQDAQNEDNRRLSELEKNGIYKSLDALKNAKADTAGTYTLLTDKERIEYSYFAGDFTGSSDDTNCIQLNSVLISQGALVRNNSRNITFRHPQAGSRARDAQSARADIVSVMDFAGADPTGATDSTDAFNRALQAAIPTTGNDDQPRREVFVPEGKWRIDGTVFVRKGQYLRGSGLGCFIDCSHRPQSNNPVFQLGKGSQVVDTDPGGLGSSISHFFMHGAPDGTGPCISSKGQAGFWIDHIFITACALGMYLSGGDGLVSHCQMDLGLTGVVFEDAGNITLWGCNFYDSNYGIRILSDCRDIEINDCHFEYQHFACILLGKGTTEPLNSRGIALRGNSFLQNVQHTTFMGAISFACSNAEVEVLGGNTFRNLFGPAIRETVGVGNKLIVHDAVFDGKRTFTHPTFGYQQTTTMSGIDASNMDVTASNCVFRDLPNTPVLVGGSVSTKLSLHSCKFTGNFGSNTEILITNTAVGSRVDLAQIEGDDRQLFNAQAATPVTATSLTRWLNKPVAENGRTVVKIPVQQSAALMLAIKANANPQGNLNYQKSAVFKALYGQDFDSIPVSQVYLAEDIVFPSIGAGGPGKLDLKLELDNVGEGTSKEGHAGSRLLALSWPSTYQNVSFNAVLEV